MQSRTDRYGGSFDNRTRFLREVIAAVRAVIPNTMPLWLRISGTEWMENTAESSWDIHESIRLAKLLPGLGVDVLDVSSGGNSSKQTIEMYNHYQIDLASQIRQAVLDDGLALRVAAVGKITLPQTAKSITDQSDEGKEKGTPSGLRDSPTADLVLAGREFLRDPHWPLNVARELGVLVKWPKQYERAKLRPVA